MKKLKINLDDLSDERRTDLIELLKMTFSSENISSDNVTFRRERYCDNVFCSFLTDEVSDELNDFYKCSLTYCDLADEEIKTRADLTKEMSAYFLRITDSLERSL